MSARCTDRNQSRSTRPQRIDRATPSAAASSAVPYRGLPFVSSRAATVRAIQIRDVDLDGGVVFYRHTKNRKAQVIPLCSPMIAILREYGRYRGGEPTDYLFCTETGTQLTESGLRQSIARYNTRRGVQKTSIHLFRHTFARKYLIDCGGDAFTLQKLLGHSTLAMTKHYCAIYDADLTKNYDNFSPLAQMKASSAKIKMPAKGR